MPLLFKHVCDLLSTLEELSARDPPHLPMIKHEKQEETLSQWLCSHGIAIHNPAEIIVALLSAILPAKRPDRVYNAQRPRLASLLKRCLSLGVERQRILDQWKIPGRGDLADCVERAMQQTDDPLTIARCRVTLEEVDAALAHLASKCRFSGPKVRECEIDMQIQASYESIYRRLHSNEAKWLTRMILKNFSCLDLQEAIVYRAFDPRLPVAMKIYDDLRSAVVELKKDPASQMINTDQRKRTHCSSSDVKLLCPRVGVKVGSPKWIKAKGGIEHAISIINGRFMSVERKHDGEYCQIHIDLAKGDDCVQIFSKHGKDSTIDRKGVHNAIKEALSIGKSESRISRNCILEGELLVWCEKTSAILDFHKIRKHILRSGCYLGTREDSQPHPWEHLMIVFFDVLLIDNDSVIHQKYEQRRKHLERLVKRIAGKSDVVWRKRIDFSKAEGPRTLVVHLANALVRRWEGLVLKPADESYFELRNSRPGRYETCWLKLKKDCIDGLGDTADFVVIGAGYDPKAVAKLKISHLSWTHFFIACLTNKRDVISRGETPSLFVFECIHDCLKHEDLKAINLHGRFRGMRPDSDEALGAFCLSFAEMDPSHPKMLAVFKQPFVFEIAGSGFDKPPNRNIFALRFPRVVKIHWDRDWRRSVSLDELQTMATHACTVPSGQTFEQELSELVEKLSQLSGGIKGKKVSWESTEDEEEPSWMADYGVLAQGAPMSARKGQTHGLPLLIRTDTNEMSPSERRQGNGGVSNGPAVAQPLTNTGSDSRPYYPSTSSTRIQKREQAFEHPDFTARDRKKARRTPLGKSKSEPQAAGARSATSPKWPLREMTNSARPVPKECQKNIDTGQESLKAGFYSMHKTATGNGQLVHEKHRMTRREDSKPPSTSMKTLDSAYNFTSTTEVYMICESYLSLKGLVNTSSSELFYPSRSYDPTIPNLEKCQIILSPCLTSSTPAFLSGLLKDFPTKIMSLPQQFRSLQNLNLTSHSMSGFQILFLVDASNATETTASSLHRLANHLRNWYALPVHVWDWRILHLARHWWSVTTRSKKDIANDLKIATMSWIPPSDHSVSAVSVRWADGSTTLQPSDTFIELERSLNQ